MKLFNLLASSAAAISLNTEEMAFAEILSQLEEHKTKNINDITQVFDKDIFSGNETAFQKKQYKK